MTPAVATEFRQIARHEMQRGLAKPIALLRLEPAEISREYGITFEPDRDDLDALLAAAIESPTGRQFGFSRHEHSPTRGTVLLTHEQSPDFKADLLEALGLLRLRRQDLTWVHPDIDLPADE
jgi:hypothetical protein